MELLDTLKIHLDNEKLMKDYGYSQKDIKALNFMTQPENEFINFMQTAILLMNNENETPRVAVNKLMRTFETQAQS